MTLIADVSLETFMRFKQQDAVFFWTELADRFIMLRPEVGMVIRTIIVKTNEENDNMFRIRNLYSHHAIFCDAFSFGITEGPLELEIQKEKERINAMNKEKEKQEDTVNTISKIR